MKTVLCVYSDKKNLNMSEKGSLKRYAFNTGEELRIGDCIKADNYNTDLVVVAIFSECFFYYVSTTGELAKELPNNSNAWTIKELKIEAKDENIVYGAFTHRKTINYALHEKNRETNLSVGTKYHNDFIKGLQDETDLDSLDDLM
jgi:hypothetical protein